MSADALPISPERFAAAIRELPLTALHLKVLELRNSIAHLDYSNEQLRPFADGTATVLGAATFSSSPLPSAASTAPGATGTATAPAETATAAPPPQPDQDCIDAIAENEAVIERMEGRIALIRTEVEGRGLSWREFRSKEEVEAEAEAAAAASASASASTPATTTATTTTTTATTANGARGSGHDVMVNGYHPSPDEEGDGREPVIIDREQLLREAEELGFQDTHSSWEGPFDRRPARRNLQVRPAAPISGDVRRAAGGPPGIGAQTATGGQTGTGPQTETVPRNGGTRPGGSLTDEELRRRVEEQMRGLGSDGDGNGIDDSGMHL